MAQNDVNRLYDEYYFAHRCGPCYQRDEHWMNFFGAIADRIVSDISPATVLDAGCAMGFLVECLRERGVEAWGMDVSEYALQNVHADVQPYCWVGSVTEPFPRKYDLIVCIEVLEHLPQPDSEKALANLCEHTDDILFSSTPVDYKEATHYNVQQPEYWAEMFCRSGFLRDVDFDASIISPWAVRFHRRRETLPRVVKEYERKFWQLWKENVDLRNGSAEMETELAAKEHLFEEKEQAVNVLTKQLDDIVKSKSWRQMQRLQRMRKRMSRVLELLKLSPRA